MGISPFSARGDFEDVLLAIEMNVSVYNGGGRVSQDTRTTGT